MQERKAASVFPELVGAAIRTSVPDAMAGQLLACTSVGEPKRPRNHSAMIGWNCERDIPRSPQLSMAKQSQARPQTSHTSGWLG